MVSAELGAAGDYVWFTPVSTLVHLDPYALIDRHRHGPLLSLVHFWFGMFPSLCPYYRSVLIDAVDQQPTYSAVDGSSWEEIW